MIALLDTSQDFDQCAAEMDCEVGQLLSPVSWRNVRDQNRPFGIDNGAFGRFDEAKFLELLGRARHRERCLFVALPDVVGSARRTLEVFERWRRREELREWKLALVCQDGQEHLPIPWDDISAVFIGGSTSWKCGEHAVHIIRAAQVLGKWVHVGRVNTSMRWDHFDKLGVNSADGTGIAQYSHMRESIAVRHHQSTMQWEIP